jgi:DNA-binding transcriptional LysR family regulator
VAPTQRLFLPRGWAHAASQEAQGHSALGLSGLAAALAFRDSGDPFAGVAPVPPALRIGLCSSLSWGFLRDLIRRAQVLPDAPALSFVQASPQILLQAARRGQIDVGFVYDLHNWARLEHEELWREPLIVAMPEHHPLARDSEVSADALRTQSFLVAGDPAESQLQITLLQRSIGGVGPAIVATPVEAATLLDLVGLGLGLALTTASALGAFHPGIAYRPVAAPFPALTFHAVWRASNRSEALRRFLDMARTLAVR